MFGHNYEAALSNRPEQHCQFSTYMKSLQNHGFERIVSGVTEVIVDAHEANYSFSQRCLEDQFVNKRQ